MRFKVFSKEEFEAAPGQIAFKIQLDLLANDQLFSGRLEFTTFDAEFAETIKAGQIIEISILAGLLRVG